MFEIRIRKIENGSEPYQCVPALRPTRGGCAQVHLISCQSRRISAPAKSLLSKGTKTGVRSDAEKGADYGPFAAVRLGITRCLLPKADDDQRSILGTMWHQCGLKVANQWTVNGRPQLRRKPKLREI
jgi:hypothetical protein